MFLSQSKRKVRIQKRRFVLLRLQNCGLPFIAVNSKWISIRNYCLIGTRRIQSASRSAHLGIINTSPHLRFWDLQSKQKVGVLFRSVKLPIDMPPSFSTTRNASKSKHIVRNRSDFLAWVLEDNDPFDFRVMLAINMRIVQQSNTNNSKSTCLMARSKIASLDAASRCY